MAFNNLEEMMRRYKEEAGLDADLPNEVQQEFASRIPTEPVAPAESGVHAPSSFDVDVSNTTLPMRGRADSLPSAASMGDAPERPIYEVEEDEPSPTSTPVPVKATPDDPKAKSDQAMEAVLSTDNDSTTREAGLADLEKRRKRGIIPQVLAGAGDAISASASAFGGNAPGGSMQRLVERQDKDIDQGKKDIETRLRNDAGSDISKQYQALLGQFMQKDPADPTILGLTANQIAEKIPSIEKIAKMRQDEELKRAQMENTRAIKDQTKSEKDARIADELWTPMGQAKTKNDAKILKDAYTGYEGTKSNLDSLIELRGAKGAEVMDRKSVNQAKTIAADLTVQYKDLAKLGVLSKDDYRLLERLIPSDPLQFDVMAHTPAALQQARDLIDVRMNAFAGGYGVTSPAQAKANSPAAATSNQRKTKAGHSYQVE